MRTARPTAASRSRCSDNGGTGNGGVDLDPTPNTFTITVTAVNDAPVNTVPGAQSVAEDTNLSLTGLSISDVDAGSATITTTLSVAERHADGVVGGRGCGSGQRHRDR